MSNRYIDKHARTDTHTRTDHTSTPEIKMNFLAMEFKRVWGWKEMLSFLSPSLIF